MNKVLYIILISLFSLTVFSCSDKEESSSSSSSSGTTTTTTDETTTSSSGSGVFVAVGYSGNIVRSTDNGSSWDNATSPTANDLHGVGF